MFGSSTTIHLIHHHTQHTHTSSPAYFQLLCVPGPGAPFEKVSPWPLIALVCSPDDATALRAALYGSSKLKEMLWASLEGILAFYDNLREGPIDVRSLLVGLFCGGAYLSYAPLLQYFVTALRGGSHTSIV
jgi:hypothetical protein